MIVIVKYVAARAVLCAALLICCTPVAPAAPTSRERQSLAVVIAGEYSGTAFFLGGRCWATAAHVVDRVPTTELVLYNGVKIAARVARRDGIHDVAVLRAGASLPSLALAARPPRPRAQVWAIGFPGASRQYGRPVPMIGRVHPARAPNGMILVEGMAFFGHSGSPLLDDAQRVVGVIVAVHRDDLDLSLAAPASAIRALMPRC
jgi:S1-C subfamily serine protease